jgi:DoxX-like family
MGSISIDLSRRNTAGVHSNEKPHSATERKVEQLTKISVALWIGQGLLAVLFLFAGGMKLAMPLEAMAAVFPLPALFMKFIGLIEVLGGLGLILPALLRIRPVLTPLAAAGLVLDMIGATVVTVVLIGLAPALMPLVVGLLLAFVAYGRWRMAPPVNVRN